MFIRKKFSVTDDGHNMSVNGRDALEEVSEFDVDDNIEKNYSIERKLMSSGNTKKKISTRKGFDNSKKRIKEILRMKYERETLFDCEPDEFGRLDYGKFRHNGTVKTYSEEEKKNFIMKRNMERILEMRKSA